MLDPLAGRFGLIGLGLGSRGSYNTNALGNKKNARLELSLNWY
jgi:hypothetical protein